MDMKTLFLSLVMVGICGCQTNPLIVDTDGGVDLRQPIAGVPLWHRPTAAACTGDRPAGGCTFGSPDLGGANCNADSNCAFAPSGRCTSTRVGCMCTYDDCSTDADCAAGTLCSCRGTLGDRPAGTNRCVTSNCRVDADCGANGYCSPSLDPSCGTYIGVSEWFCHTSQDTCINDSDCPSTGGVTPFCGYKPEIGHWSCLSALCAG